jgi:hypothetical protein
MGSKSGVIGKILCEFLRGTQKSGSLYWCNSLGEQAFTMASCSEQNP